MTTVRWSQLVGQRALERESGQLLGSLRRALLDPAAPAVTAVQLEGGGSGITLVDWSAIASVGPDAVTIEADAARDPRDERERDLLNGRLDFEGKLVLTELGDALGQLTDIEIDIESGRLVRLHVPGEAVEVERIIAFGPDMLILPEEVQPGADQEDA